MKALLTIALLLCSGLVRAAPVTLDFEGLLRDTVVSTQFADRGVLIASDYGAVTVFDGCCAASGVNTLNGGGFRGVTLTFVDPDDMFRPATTDFFSVTLGDVDIPGNGLTAYDLDGNQIAQVLSGCATAFACPGDSLFETLTLSVAGMHRVVIAAGGQLSGNAAQGEATVDDVVFNAVVAQVPEPSALQLLAAGLSVLACVALSRRLRAVRLSRGRSASR